MIAFPEIDPVAIALGPLKVRWYGLCYVVGILTAWILMNYRIGQPHYDWNRQQVSDLVFYATLGIIIGGRLGSVLFYNFPYYVDNPLEILKIWKGGMAFHGGLLGVLFAVYWYSRSQNKSFFSATDLIAPVVPIGLGAGRIGNFINGELWGRASDVPWAMVFPHAEPLGLARHPSQLYQFLLEGVLLFLILWFYSAKPRPLMSVSGLFLLFYGLFRFAVEYFREPDAHLGFIAFDWLTMGQLLSIPMILFGLLIYFLAIRRHSNQSL